MCDANCIYQIISLQELHEAIKELSGLLAVHPMPSSGNILKFCLSEQFFDQIVISNRNVVAISTSYENCGTLKREINIERDIFLNQTYLIHSPLGIWKHRYSF